MLCSAAELELSNDHDGIIKLPDDAPIGVPYVEYAKLGGVVFDISITPNRGDATGVYGVARDLAAFGLGTLEPDRGYGAGAVARAEPDPAAAAEVRGGRAQGDPQVRRAATFKGVKNGPSPEWLQQRLRAVGPAPDQRAGRHHQLRVARLGPAAPRL